ncbi:MAG: PKD domain-containing protein [Bacteroidota bacterium]|nr:PKD domain-containing protein [Bacteroidota bacterium]
MDFNVDPPIVLYDGKTFEEGTGLISNNQGNIILYTDGKHAFNSEHDIIENGDLLWNPSWQGNVIIPFPDNNDLYYVFSATRHPDEGLGFYYSLVDMSYNSGQGKIIEKNILLNDAWDASTRVLAVKHQNGRDYWVLTRKFITNEIAAFLVTPAGLEPNAVLSEAQTLPAQCNYFGFMKISYDKKYIISSYQFGDTEVYRFDAATGKATFLHTLLMETIGGIEFSPDSKYAYMTKLTLDSISGEYQYKISQYEMKYIEDPSLFRSSKMIIGQPRGFVLQLARDGKIYCSDTYENYDWDYLGVISNPWLRGNACNYIADAIDVSPGQSLYGLPNVVMDYNLRFFFEGDCEGIPFTFQHNFLPVPDSIEWNFGDTLSGANNISNQLNPTHVFSDGGEYEVSVDVWYPSGRFEHTSRMLQVTYAPWPDLGPDLEICYGEEVTLTANGGPGYHTWNTGSHDTSIIVSDTGWYWVKIKNTAQCTSTDSIYIGYSESPAIDSSNLVITPTGCGGSTGSIEGLQFSGNGPFSYLWTDDAGNPLDTTLNLYNLPVGNYTLFVTDTNACQWPYGPF